MAEAQERYVICEGKQMCFSLPAGGKCSLTRTSRQFPVLPILCKNQESARQPYRKSKAGRTCETGNGCRTLV